MIYKIIQASYKTVSNLKNVHYRQKKKETLKLINVNNGGASYSKRWTESEKDFILNLFKLFNTDRKLPITYYVFINLNISMKQNIWPYSIKITNTTIYLCTRQPHGDAIN